MSNDRKEAADIARQLRRYIERERLQGTAELLADGATKAQRGDGAPYEGSAPGAGRAGEFPRRVEARREPGTGGGGLRLSEGAQEARPGRPGGRTGPPGAPLDTNLFGETIARPTPETRSDVASILDAPLPPMFADDLNPAGLEPRHAIHDASEPVLAAIAKEVIACTQCGLCETRTRAVPGVGTARSGIVFVGEAPGADEDRLGEPFVGRAGQLLDKIIKAMDEARLIPGVPLNRETVYICNVLKCRPPENRNPLPHEIELCSPFLRRQLDVIRPRIICCLGKFAAELLCGVKGTIGGLRGKVYRYQGAKLIVTYHPAACLRNPSFKRPVWEDMQLLAREYLSD